MFDERVFDEKSCTDKFQIYCSEWKLKVNSEKPNVVIFGDKSRHRSPISFNDQPLEVVDCFEYLGVV